MAKITRDEIAEKDLFINIVKSAKEAREELVVLESTLDLIKDTAKVKVLILLINLFFYQVEN